MARLLKTKPLQPNPFESFSKSTSDDSDDNDSPFTKTEFVVYDNTVIKFGKLKGKMHSELLKPENLNYSNWLMSQNKNEKFFYKATCRYLEKKLKPTADNLDITSTDYIYLADLQNPTDEQKKRMKYFEANLSSYFVKLSECE
jgi:hypothetical protein